MNFNYRIILGSKSPRRKQLLHLITSNFTIEAIETDESYPASMDAKEVASYIALQKAKGHTQLKENELLLTADTTVIVDDAILTKPEGQEEAENMLKKLSGRSHLVNTAVCISDINKTEFISELTKVFFPQLSDSDIANYIEQFKPFDKAGAYGIQECIKSPDALLTEEERNFLISTHELVPYIERNNLTTNPAFRISDITGSYFNVVGLPIVALNKKLNEWIED